MKKLYEEGKIKTKPSSVQGPAPVLFPDMYWVWEAYCFLAERRNVGPNGPTAITAQDMLAYAELTGRTERYYLNQLLRFIPVLDRHSLKEYYEARAKEIEKQQKKAEASSRNSR